MHRKTFAFAILAASLLGTLASSASAAPSGPPIGNNKYRSVIQDVNGESDTDDYVQRFVKGELLTVVVSGQPSEAGGSFLPLLELVDPDGLVRFANVTYAKDDRVALLTRFPIDKSGLWAARVSGRPDGDGVTDQGEYVVAFRVKPLAKLAFANQRLGNDQPFSRTHRFASFDGALLDAKLVFDRRGLDVEMRALLDPSGADVLYLTSDNPPQLRPVIQTAVTRRQTVTLKGVRLSKGEGDYSLRVRIPTAEGRYSLQLRVNPGTRPASKKVQQLSALEPVLVARQFPLAGDPGTTIRLEGVNFATGSPAPRVIFGGNDATGVVVGGGGTTIDCTIPPKGLLAVVPVSVVNPDGQVSTRDRYFAYVPAPVITDFQDAATSAPIRQYGTNTLKPVKILGANFLAGQVVTVAGVNVPTYTLDASGTEIRFNLPVVPQGNATLTVADEFGRSATSPFQVFFKTPPTFHPTAPYVPGAIKLNVAATVTVKGSAFDATDVLEFRGSVHPSTFVDSSTRTFDVPALGAGSYPVVLVDSIGTRVTGPNLDVKLPPTITTVLVAGAPVIGTKDIPLSGGSPIQVDGSDFGVLDTVTLGGSPVTQFAERTPTRLRFTAPGASPGAATLSIVDGAGQSATLAAAVNYVGFTDATAARKDAASATDDFGASRGAVGDLDGDGAVDDVILVATYNTEIGTRSGLSRLLLGDATGKLRDNTSTKMPAARTDSSGTDTFDANVLALGDVDRSGSQDLVIAGVGATYFYPQYYGEVRLMRNTGGTFTLDEGNAPPTRYEPRVYCTFKYYSGYTMTVYTGVYPRGAPRGLALGDLDRDGDVDLVVGNDHYDLRYVQLDPRQVDFSKSPPEFLGYYYYAKYYLVNYAQYRTATRLYDNRFSTGAGFVDLSKTKLPSAGDNKTGSVPKRAFHSTDLALGDIDVDGDLDMVIAWNDPTTVTPFGLYTKTYSGVSSDSPKVATSVLLNSGTGTFTTDNTTAWMPPGSAPEFWHADRMLLDDLDGDGDPELLLLLKDSVDAYTGAITHGRSALRILRNDRTRFVDITVSALPTVNLGSSDDFRGTAIAVRDVNGDGRKDILVGTTEALQGAGSSTLRRTRLFAGTTTLRWAAAAEFTTPLSIDSGEASDLLFVRDLGGAGNAPLLLLSDVVPSVSPLGEKTRISDWKK